MKNTVSKLKNSPQEFNVILDEAEEKKIIKFKTSFLKLYKQKRKKKKRSKE